MVIIIEQCIDMGETMPHDTVKPQHETLPDCVEEAMPVLALEQEAVVFKIGAEWCGPCHRLDAYLDSADGKKDISGFALRRVDYYDKDKALYKCFSDNHYVDLETMKIPAFLVFDHGVRFSGYFVYDHTKPLADQILDILNASRSQATDQTPHP